MSVKADIDKMRPMVDNDIKGSTNVEDYRSSRLATCFCLTDKQNCKIDIGRIYNDERKTSNVGRSNEENLPDFRRNSDIVMLAVSEDVVKVPVSLEKDINGNIHGAGKCEKSQEIVIKSYVDTKSDVQKGNKFGNSSNIGPPFIEGVGTKSSKSRKDKEPILENQWKEVSEGRGNDNVPPSPRTFDPTQNRLSILMQKYQRKSPNNIACIDVKSDGIIQVESFKEKVEQKVNSNILSLPQTAAFKGSCLPNFDHFRNRGLQKSKPYLSVSAASSSHLTDVTPNMSSIPKETSLEEKSDIGTKCTELKKSDHHYLETNQGSHLPDVPISNNPLCHGIELFCQAPPENRGLPNKPMLVKTSSALIQNTPYLSTSVPQDPSAVNHYSRSATFAPDGGNENISDAELFPMSLLEDRIQAVSNRDKNKDDDEIVATKLTRKYISAGQNQTKGDKRHILNNTGSSLEGATNRIDNQKKSFIKNVQSSITNAPAKRSPRHRSLPNLDLICKMQNVNSAGKKTSCREVHKRNSSIEITTKCQSHLSTEKLSDNKEIKTSNYFPMRNCQIHKPRENPLESGTPKDCGSNILRNSVNLTAPVDFHRNSYNAGTSLSGTFETSVNTPVNPVTVFFERYKSGLVCDDISTKEKLRNTSRKKDSPRNKPVIVSSSTGSPPGMQPPTEPRSAELRFKMGPRNELRRSISLDDVSIKNITDRNTSFKSTSEKIRELSSSLESLVAKVSDISKNALQRHQSFGEESANFVELTRANAVASFKNRPWKSMENLSIGSKDLSKLSPVFCRHLKEENNKHEKIEQKSTKILSQISEDLHTKLLCSEELVSKNVEHVTNQHEHNGLLTNQPVTKVLANNQCGPKGLLTHKSSEVGLVTNQPVTRGLVKSQSYDPKGLVKSHCSEMGLVTSQAGKIGNSQPNSEISDVIGGNSLARIYNYSQKEGQKRNEGIADISVSKHKDIGQFIRCNMFRNSEHVLDKNGQQSRHDFLIKDKVAVNRLSDSSKMLKCARLENSQDNWRGLKGNRNRNKELEDCFKNSPHDKNQVVSCDKDNQEGPCRIQEYQTENKYLECLLGENGSVVNITGKGGNQSFKGFKNNKDSLSEIDSQTEDENLKCVSTKTENILNTPKGRDMQVFKDFNTNQRSTSGIPGNKTEDKHSGNGENMVTKNKTFLRTPQGLNRIIDNNINSQDSPGKEQKNSYGSKVLEVDLKKEKIIKTLDGLSAWNDCLNVALCNNDQNKKKEISKYFVSRNHESGISVKPLYCIAPEQHDVNDVNDVKLLKNGMSKINKTQLISKEEVTNMKLCFSSPQHLKLKYGGKCGTIEPPKDTFKEIQESNKSVLLEKVLGFIHNEFAFDGYMNDGVEDVKMAEFVISKARTTEEDLKKALRNEYKDLYWKDKLVSAMYNVVQSSTETPALFTSLLTAADPMTFSISRNNSELSSSSSGESSSVMSNKISDRHEIISFGLDEIGDLKNDLTVVFNDYHRNIGVFLATTVNVLVEKLPFKIKEVHQQINLERRLKRRAWKSYLKLVNSADLGVKETKDMDGKLRHDIEEMEWKIAYLKNIKKKLKNIYAERFALDFHLLKSFIEQFSTAHTSIHPYIDNDYLSFSWPQHRGMFGPDNIYKSKEGADLQHGTQTGLLAYLFVRRAMIEGYVKYFFYTYRYCITSSRLLEFVREKYLSSVSFDDSKEQTIHQIQIQYRVLDLVTEWLEDYYAIDFKNNESLRMTMRNFLEQEVINTDKSDRGNTLLHMLTEKEGTGKLSLSYSQRSTVNTYLEDLGNIGISEDRATIDENSSRRFNRNARSSLPFVFTGCEAFILDYSDQMLAEQLSLIQQDIFHRLHPVHFLNTRSLGVGIARKSTPNTIASHKDIVLGFSAGLRRGSTDSNELISETSTPATLAEGIDNEIIEQVIEHAQNLSMWIAGEICGMPSIKTQLSLITKFVNVAQCCQELRNFETSIQIVDALETFLVRQLPVWKQVSTKTYETLDRLKAVKVLLKTDASWLIHGDTFRRKPTIPSVLLFIMHVQQEEIGGLLLVNGMYKWAKLKSIARLVDQIRAFQELKYGFPPNEELQVFIKRCITNLKDQNLHLIASENSINFHGSRSSTSSKKFKNALEKVKSSFI